MMLAVALFIAAGALNAWALLVPARRVTRGSNRILSEANLAQLKLVASDAAAGDEFGYSVAIDGDTLVVGAYAKDSDTGSVYVFRTSDGGATYGQVAKLTASDGASGDKFGVSVAIDGATVAVGADEWGNDGPGAAYVFSLPALDENSALGSDSATRAGGTLATALLAFAATALAL